MLRWFSFTILNVYRTIKNGPVHYGQRINIKINSFCSANQLPSISGNYFVANDAGPTRRRDLLSKGIFGIFNSSTSRKRPLFLEWGREQKKCFFDNIKDICDETARSGLVRTALTFFDGLFFKQMAKIRLEISTQYGYRLESSSFYSAVSCLFSLLKYKFQSASS